jgi:hypothetical protein
MMKKLYLLSVCLIVSLSIGCSKSISDIDNVEELFQENNYNYTAKPMEEEYQVDNAADQRVYEIEGIGEVYIYHFSESIERYRGDLVISNELLRDYAVAPTKYFLFVYKDSPPEQNGGKIHVIIDEIIKSEKED